MNQHNGPVRDSFNENEQMKRRRGTIIIIIIITTTANSEMNIIKQSEK